MNVLVIAEDDRNDRYILLPIIRAMFRALKPAWTWKQIQRERDPKEHYFEPIARHRDLLDSVAQGRKILGEEAGSNYSRVRQNCPELRELEARIQKWLSASER